MANNFPPLTGNLEKSEIEEFLDKTGLTVTPSFQRAVVNSRKNPANQEPYPMGHTAYGVLDSESWNSNANKLLNTTHDSVIQHLNSDHSLDIPYNSEEEAKQDPNYFADMDFKPGMTPKDIEMQLYARKHPTVETTWSGKLFDPTNAFAGAFWLIFIITISIIIRVNISKNKKLKKYKEFLNTNKQLSRESVKNTLQEIKLNEEQTSIAKINYDFINELIRNNEENNSKKSIAIAENAKESLFLNSNQHTAITNKLKSMRISNGEVTTIEVNNIIMDKNEKAYINQPGKIVSIIQASGNLVVTNKRIIFSGDKQAFSSEFPQLIESRLIKNGISISFRNKSTPVEIKFYEPAINLVVGALINYAINSNTKS